MPGWLSSKIISIRKNPAPFTMKDILQPRIACMTIEAFFWMRGTLMLSSMPVQQYLARVKRDRVMLFRNDNDVIWIDPVQEEAFWMSLIRNWKILIKAGLNRANHLVWVKVTGIWGRREISAIWFICGLSMRRMTKPPSHTFHLSIKTPALHWSIVLYMTRIFNL